MYCAFNRIYWVEYFKLKEQWRKTCPVCKRNNTRPDYDFPETMQNCNSCGSEWNEIDINFNARKDV